MKIVIVGAGALGCYYGAMLVRSGCDVYFLMRRDYDAVCKNGLTVLSPNGDFHLKKVHCYRSTSEIGGADLVFVGLKTTSNSFFEELIHPLLREDTLILTAQNGLGNEEELAGLFGQNHVAGGLAFLCANRLKPGTVQHLRYGHMNIGNFQRKPDRKIQCFSMMLNKSGVSCDIIEDLSLARWEKLIWNIPFNGLSALTNQTVDKIVKDKSLRSCAYELMKEAQMAAASYGLMISDAFLEKMMGYSDALETYYTSMHLDFLNSRPMEFESIIGEPLRRGLKNAVPMPQTESLYRKLLAVQSTNHTQSLPQVE